MKKLNLTPADCTNCTVTFNINRFEVYHANGWMITAAQTKADLKSQLSENGIVGAKFDSAAQRKYLAASVKKANPFNCNAPYNPAFLGAQPAQAGQDY